MLVSLKRKDNLPVPGSEIGLSRSVKRNAKNATAPFPKSRASYFRFPRFNTSALYYLRAWLRLKDNQLVETPEYDSRDGSLRYRWNTQATCHVEIHALFY